MWFTWFVLFQDFLFSMFFIWVFVLGGESTADNCQILQTRVNRFKSDKEVVDKTQLKGYSCDVQFTGIVYSCLFYITFTFCNCQSCGL